MEPKYRVENNHEPIISKDIFDMVQAEKKKDLKYLAVKIMIERNIPISMPLVESYSAINVEEP